MKRALHNGQTLDGGEAVGDVLWAGGRGDRHHCGGIAEAAVNHRGEGVDRGTGHHRHPRIAREDVLSLEAIEERARSELGLVKENEQFYQVVPGKDNGSRDQE